MNLIQNDSIETYQFEPDTGQVQPDVAFHKPQTPYQAIKLLPYNATEEQKDEIVQKYFKPVIVAPSNRPDTLSIPGLKSTDPTLKDLPTYRDGFFKNNALLHPELKVTLQGIAGDPIPYRLRTDVFVTSTLLLSFMVVMYIFARSMHVMGSQLKNFFYNRDRKQIFTLKSDSEMKNQSFIILLACFLLTILFFNYTEERMTSVFNRVSPYKLLAIDMGIFLVYYFLKYAYYGILNWTFFSEQKRSQWFNAYNLIVLGRAFCFFPLVLLAVYFDLEIQKTITVFLIILALSEMLVIFKAKQIFFVYKFGALHLFLYFCTLEAAPLLVLWKALVSANQYLIEIV